MLTKCIFKKAICEIPIPYIYRLYCTNNNANEKIIQNCFGITSNAALALVNNNPILRTIDNKKLLNTCQMLRKTGIKSTDLKDYPILLTIPTAKLEHNVLYLSEAGFSDITAQILVRFRTLVKKPIGFLKTHNVIPSYINVPERFYSFLHPKPKQFDVLKTFSENDSVMNVHQSIYKHYLVWRLNTTMNEVEKLFEKKRYGRFKYKSLKLVSELIELLLTDIGITKHKLLNNESFFQPNPNVVKQTMKDYPELLGVNIKELLRMYPKLMTVPIENTLEICRLLKEFEISEKSTLKSLEIFSFSPETVAERINEMKTTPEFQCFMKHNRVVEFLVMQKKVKSRLEHLKQLKIKCASLHVLCAHDTVFEKYIQEGNDRTKGYDIFQYLGNELDVEVKGLRKQLNVNLRWFHVPLTTVQTTLNYLMESGFRKEDVVNLVIILFYPRDKIKAAFEESKKNSEINNTVLLPKEHLNICLYLIEKKYHFSGDGLWKNGPTNAK